MTIAINFRAVSPPLVLAAGAILTMPAVHAAGWRGIGEFEDARIRVERNATDGDTEIVITAKPLTDGGLARLSIVSPHWRKVVDVEAPSKTRGLREFLFETPEPDQSQILNHYPEGSYLYFGTATNGQRFVGAATLSHELPGEVTIASPVKESVIAPGAMTIVWAAVPDAAQYIVEFENESADPEQSFSFVVGASITSFTVPGALVVPSSDYQIGVAAVHENGNLVFSETTFSTAD
jgi:hypothetical protein